MDARGPRIQVIFCACALFLTGCTVLEGTITPAPNRPGPPERPRELEVVDGAASPTTQPGENAALVSETVRKFIGRIDESAPRAPRTAQTGNVDPSEDPTAADAPALPPDDVQSEPHDAVGVSKLGSAGRSQTSSPGQTGDATVTTTARPAAALQPPVLASVAVGAEPVIEEQQASTEDEGARPNMPVKAERAPVSLREFLEQWKDVGEDAPFRRQLDLRVLRVIAGDYEAARQPLAMVSTEQQQMAARLIESLIAVREAHDGDPGAAANRVLEEVQRLEESLRPLSELRVPTLTICHEVTGFGQYKLIDPPRFPAGASSEFVAYCEIRDFTSQKQDDGTYLSKFELRTRVLNTAGEAVLDIRDAEVVDRCRQQRHDCFVPRLVRLPATLSPGQYVVKITVTDKLADKVAENRTTFRVVAGP